jgi:hypothetical protein
MEGGGNSRAARATLLLQRDAVVALLQAKQLE